MKDRRMKEYRIRWKWNYKNGKNSIFIYEEEYGCHIYVSFVVRRDRFLWQLSIYIVRSVMILNVLYIL